jgi:molecular chaperone GrpE
MSRYSSCCFIQLINNKDKKMSEAIKSQKDHNQEFNEQKTVPDDSSGNTQEHDECCNVPHEDTEQNTESSKTDESNYKSIIEDLKDKLMRTAAELQNVKRRAEQDIQKARSYSIESFAKDLLGVMDNLYRAAGSVSEEEAQKDEKFKIIRDGVEITRKEMLNIFERNKIRCIDPLGEKFDHNFHQAMSQIEDNTRESGTIISVMQVGYVIKDRLIRPALVVIVK